MKKTMLLILALAAMLTPVFAEPGSDKDRFSKNYDYSGFTTISVSHSFRVDLNFADRYEVYVATSRTSWARKPTGSRPGSPCRR